MKEKHPITLQSIADVKYESTGILKGNLYLPTIGVYDETEVVLRNLLAYEYVVEKRTDLLSFVHLMDNLLDNEQDVKFLKDKGVLKKRSWGSDQSIANMWNTLSIGVVYRPSPHFIALCENISGHYSKRWARIMEEFRTLHLRKPWVVLGAILVLITFITTIMAMLWTVLTYYYGNKQRIQT
jgi:hypothetical protein